MSPREKAKELVDKFQKQIFFAVTDERLDIEEAKGCALIAVDEVIKNGFNPQLPYNYWEEVKQETKNFKP